MDDDDSLGLRTGPRAYRKGPVMLRHRQVPHSTTDQRLLDTSGSADWVHTDPWRVLRIQSEFVEGFGALAELGRAVSVFGSARIAREDPTYALAQEIGRRLAEAGYAVITGGGPGAMEAANRGALEGGGVSVGLGIELLFEALTLVQTQKVTSFPIVLLGTRYWGGLLDWLSETAQGMGTIGPKDLDLLTLTDDVDEALRTILDGNDSLDRPTDPA